MNKLMKISLVLTLFLLICGILIAPVSAATTQVQIVKYANDNTTILNQTTVNYTWMQAHLPVLGDGVTHYYAQGPVFVDNTNETLEQELRWNPAEDTNVDTKDMGAVKGTNLKDLCNLVGGMSPGEQVKILSSDGWNDWYAYKNVYEYSSREGPLGICWYQDGKYPDTGYSDGMRMVWFADTSVNPGGLHAFGNYDWHEAAAPEYWYYYISGGEYYPTTTGLSGKYVNRIFIYSNEAPPVAPVAAFSADPVSGTAPLTVNFTDASSGTPTSWAWDFTNDGTVDSTEPSPSHIYDTAGTYTVNLTVTNAGGSDSEVKTGYITVSPAGPAAPVAAFTAAPLSGTAPLTVQFTDASTGTPTSWAWDFNNDGTVDSTAQSPSYTYTSAGTYTVSLIATNTAGSDDEIKTNYITVSPPPPWNLTLVGASSYTMSNTEFEALAAAYPVSWTDTSSNIWTGVALWRLVAIVDDSDPTTFNDDLAGSGYNVRITAVDGFSRNFASATIARNDSRILANKKNSLDLPVSQFPLKFVGPGLSSGNMVNRVVTITAMVPPPTAAFTSDVQTGSAPLAVQFTDQSTGSPASWAWDINNDGTVEYTTKNATHIFTTAGTYTVNLTVTNAAGSDSEVKTDYITVTIGSPNYSLLLTGDHTVTVTKAQIESIVASGQNVTYTDTSNGRIWNGIPLWYLVGAVDDSDTGYNFNNTRAAMNYVVQIRAGDGYFRNFTSSTIAGSSNYIVANTLNGSALPFTDPSNPSKLWWPLKHVGPGMSSGNSVGNITEIRLIGLPVLPIANFTAIPLAGTAPLSVQFTDQSTGTPTSWAWDFTNDGPVDSTEQSPSHIYNTAGTYSVNFTVTNAGGSDSEVKTDYITVNAAPVTPTLSVTPATTSVPVSGTTNYQLMMNTLPHGLAGYNLTVSLDHPAIGEITAVSMPAWAILNGSSSLPADTVIFNAIDLEKQIEPGATNVVLATITVRGDTPGSSGINLTIGQMDADGGDQITPFVQNGQFTAYLPLTANFTATPLVGTLPLTVQFTDLSTGDPLPTAWAWDFNNDGIVDNTTQSPGYTYTAAGHYSVNLTTSNQFDSDTMVKSSYIWVKPNVVPFPGYTLPPTDPDGDELYEDINGNGRLDFDDVVAFYQNMAWIEANTEVGIAPYDYNHNGRIDYDDVVVLYYEVLAAP